MDIIANFGGQFEQVA